MSRKLGLGARCLGLVFLPVFVLQIAVATAQEESTSGGASLEGELQEYLKLSEPGPEHAKLEMRVGSWKVASTFYPEPGAPPTQSEASATIRPILKGRYFRETYRGEFLGQKFTGIGMYGYDKGLKKYVSTWMDSMSTGLMRSEGTADDSGKVISYVGEYFDPMRQESVKNKYVLTLTSRKTHTTVMYELSADGEQRKVMELVYTRVHRDEKQGAKNDAESQKGENREAGKRRESEKQDVERTKA